MAKEREEWCRQQLCYQFRNPDLLVEALTHTTYAYENAGTHANERLEFLGDAVVGLVVADYLFQRYAALPEGELTKIRAAVVCEPSLAARARALAIGAQLRFGRGELESGRERNSILADAFESVVGALYLDGGLEESRRFVLRELAPLVRKALGGQVRVDYKTRLQEELQRHSTEAPTYRILNEDGPPHDKRFQAGVFHRAEMLGSGWGRNKKEAEQEAAREAVGQAENRVR